MGNISTACGGLACQWWRESIAFQKILKKIWTGCWAIAKSTVGFGVVDYGHVMTPPNERLTESLDSDAIPPKIMRRIERRHVTEAKRCHQATARLLSR